MQYYRHNVKLLARMAPFRVLSISAAYLTPFFLSKGLGLSKVFLLQSIFSIALLLWEVPSGYLADKFGRAFCIKVSGPFAALSMIAYGLSNQFWQFAVCELVLALADGLISGIDTALLIDSLKADGYEGEELRAEFTRGSQRLNAYGFAATAVGVPVALGLVHFVNLASTLVADGLLTLVCVGFSLRLVEAPRFNGGQEAERMSAWLALGQMARNVEARWLVLLSTALSTATLLGFWMTTPFYNQLGVPVVWFGAVLAVRSLWKAWLLHRCQQRQHVERNLFGYAVLAGVGFVAMASGYWWLAWLVLGHDVVQALQAAPITSLLNAHMHQDYRATLNSMVNLVRRLLFSVAGPLLGLLVEKTSLRVGALVCAGMVSSLAVFALLRLRALGTFRALA